MLQTSGGVQSSYKGGKRNRRIRTKERLEHQKEELEIIMKIQKRNIPNYKGKTLDEYHIIEAENQARLGKINKELETLKSRI